MNKNVILAALLAVTAAVAMAAGPTVTWDRHSLIVDGKRVCPVMGEVHYSRVPENEWQREVTKMKEGGVTIIATYVFWNHVEEQKGIYRWDGQRNLRRFLEVCRQQQMPVVLRLGPFCHGEARNGGIPDWMFAHSDEKARTNGTAEREPEEKPMRLRSTDPRFLAEVEKLYRQIFTQVQGLQWKDGGPVVAAQFDNEYRGSGDYLMALKKIAREIGFDLPFYTRTGWPELSKPVPYGEMIPLYGDYADGFWEKDVREGVGNYYKAFSFKESPKPATEMGEIAEAAKATKDSMTVSAEPEAYPYFTCELGGGMATAYHRRPYIYADDTYAMAVVKLGSGSNLLGYYMYHGGTNPEGVLHTLNEVQTSPGTANNDLPVCTYDFQAPLGEFGQTSDTYYRLRPLHLFMHDYGEVLAPMEVLAPRLLSTAATPGPTAPARGDDGRLRWSVRASAAAPGDGAAGKGAFIFVNNYERFANLTEKRDVVLQAAGVKLPKMTIPAGTIAIFPVNIDGIRYATAQLVARRNGKIYLMQVKGIPTIIAMEGGKTLKNVKPRGTEKTVCNNVCLLSQEDAERLFLESDDSVLRVSSSDRDDRLRSSLHLQFEKLKEAGPLRQIVKGRAKVAEAPSEADWKDAAVYRITLPAHDVARREDALLSISYQGDCARLYADGKLVADNFQYGRAFLYGLWRLPQGVGELQLRILPWQNGAPIYMPREADKTAGERVKQVEIVWRE